MGPENDQPPKALQKYVNDWQAQRLRTLPSDGSEWPMGPADADAAVKVVIWGDYLEPYTAELDERIRTIVDGVDIMDGYYRGELTGFSEADQSYIFNDTAARVYRMAP